jgi:hypothetical protein
MEGLPVNQDSWVTLRCPLFGCERRSQMPNFLRNSENKVMQSSLLVPDTPLKSCLYVENVPAQEEDQNKSLWSHEVGLVISTSARNDLTIYPKTN